MMPSSKPMELVMVAEEQSLTLTELVTGVEPKTAAAAVVGMVATVAAGEAAEVGRVQEGVEPVSAEAGQSVVPVMVGAATTTLVYGERACLALWHCSSKSKSDPFEGLQVLRRAQAPPRAGNGTRRGQCPAVAALETTIASCDLPQQLCQYRGHASPVAIT